MKMTGEKIIKAPRQEVWDALNNAEQLEKAIPGAEKVEKVDDNNLIATVKTKIGPISARFSGKIKLSDINPPISYVLTGEGTGGAAGFAKGEARITLEDIGQDTLLKYEVDARVGGKLAQIGQRLIDTAANKLADEFFGKFNEIINLDDKNITENLPDKSSSYEGMSTLSWGIGLITLVTLAVVFWFIIGKI
ncbi:MAG: carbon monoxide dehydrogenase subunit G [Pseudomonadota bacterium]|nr:carbon monoxide dehydrogenase subunit G [Pseudomonadota bacterium]